MERAIAGAIILDVLIPKDFNANNSEFEDSFPYDKSVDNKTAIGKDKTRKLGRLYIKAFRACMRGRPYSTTFLIRSNITPTESEITVNAEIANSMGAII